MKKIIVIALISLPGLLAFVTFNIQMKLTRATSVDSLGACQGISYQKGRIFLYGDREVGMIREFRLSGDSLVYLNKEYKLTVNGKDVISHPTGIAYNGVGPTFMGNSVKMNPEGTLWKTNIYCIDWKLLLKTGTLDASLINTIDDDACIQGTRPEYVKYEGRWYVATADYGNHGNEVRLYDPEKLKNCKKTTDPGVLYKKFTCTPWVQNLYWMGDKDILVLIQNQIEGRKWRFTYVDFKKSIEEGSQQVIKVIDVDDRADELEGYAFIGNNNKGIAVTSSRKNNVNYMDIGWQ
ncbi:MAG: hypothetical protein ACXVAY_06450 [Mucilaginibacter sp.]